MRRSSRKPVTGACKSEAARRMLIRREMRFVLQQDDGRFAKQLLARLLDEGCNLHPYLARKMFYAKFEHWLGNILPAERQTRFYEKVSGANPDLNHSRFHLAVKYSIKHLSEVETRLTAAVLDIIATLKEEWRQMAEKCLPLANAENTDLHNLIARIHQLNSNGYLARHGFDTICRRLRIALVTSLMRHARQPDLLREEYGSVPQLLKAINREPELFGNLIGTFKKQIPYAQHIIAQTFWRTLNNMDAEIPDQSSKNSPPALIGQATKWPLPVSKNSGFKREHGS